METKLKRLLKRKKISQKRLYQMICQEYETPVGLYALNQIVNGKKVNYHLITLVKICKVLKCKPHSIVESEVLHERLKRLKNQKESERKVMDTQPELDGAGFDSEGINHYDDRLNQDKKMTF